ncbi:MAG TPA: FMN-binding negative transcriptional regulator [Croceibacterium sp.]|nr:FMN-binding negative transcriptional regulator [Croceibacterium sp.]
MHPNPLFRTDDRALLEALIEEVGFGMVFAQTGDGPRVAHTPIVSTGDGAVQFHLARGNALTRYLVGQEALVVINGPDAYVTPRWYADANTVPTWDYVTLELQGPVRKMGEEGLLGLLDAIAERHEERIAGEPWTRGGVGQGMIASLLRGIVGFEMEVRAWRPTFKLSQNKSAEDRAAIADALEAQGSPALATLIRKLTD